ncbi:MAG: DedA family protein [Candidatus Berkelbacteria bacterium]|nr:DedA family protein [Candidatus Berkelbacteria bacterium]
MFENLLAIVFHFLAHLGIWGAMISMIIENLGIPFPTEVGYLIAQNIINLQKLDYFVVLIILTLGHVIGAVISYRIGKFGDSKITKQIWKGPKIKAVHEKLTVWYQKYGTLTVFLTRFVGYVRPWSSLVAGFANVPFWPFLIWTAIGSFLFNIIVLYFTDIFLSIWRHYTGLHFLLVVCGLILFFGLVIYKIIEKWYKKRRKSAKA